jgi:hypothetical protein
MARKLRYGKGKGSIEITGPQKELFEQALQEVAGETIKVLERELDERVEHAKENWNVRYGKPVVSKKTGKTTIKKEESKDSIDKFYTGIRILSGGKEIEGFFGNDAPYAYMIIAADYSQRKNGSPSTVPAGENVAEKTMWEPSRKKVNKLIKKLADAYIIDQKKKV